jgi:hypothetical protein
MVASSTTARHMCARIEKPGIHSGFIKQSRHPTQTDHSHHPDSALL